MSMVNGDNDIAYHVNMQSIIQSNHGKYYDLTIYESTTMTKLLCYDSSWYKVGESYGERVMLTVGGWWTLSLAWRKAQEHTCSRYPQKTH